MDIKNINPVTMKFEGNSPERKPKTDRRPREKASKKHQFQAVHTCEIEYRSRPNSLEVRKLLASSEVSQNRAAEMADIPISLFASWISPGKKLDCPTYILKKLQQELNNDC